MRLVRLLHDRRKRPVQHITIHFTGERSRVLMEVPAEAVNTMGAGQIVHDLELPPACALPVSAAAERHGSFVDAPPSFRRAA